MIVLEDLLAGGFPERKELWGSLAEGVKSEAKRS